MYVVVLLLLVTSRLSIAFSGAFANTSLIHDYEGRASMQAFSRSFLSDSCTNIENRYLMVWNHWNRKRLNGVMARDFFARMCLSRECFCCFIVDSWPLAFHWAEKSSKEGMKEPKPALLQFSQTIHLGHSDICFLFAATTRICTCHANSCLCFYSRSQHLPQESWLFFAFGWRHCVLSQPNPALSIQTFELQFKPEPPQKKASSLTQAQAINIRNWQFFAATASTSLSQRYFRKKLKPIQLLP